MNDKLSLIGCRFLCYVGCTDEERDVPQLVELDVELCFDACPSAKSDALCDTIDSMALHAVVKRCVEEGRYHLIETLVEKIAESVLHGFPIERVRVCLHKPQPMIPHGGGYVAIEIVRP